MLTADATATLPRLTSSGGIIQEKIAEEENSVQIQTQSAGQRGTVMGISLGKLFHFECYKVASPPKNGLQKPQRRE